MLIHNKDYIEFVTEYPCLLGHPVFYVCTPTRVDMFDLKVPLTWHLWLIKNDKFILSYLRNTCNCLKLCLITLLYFRKTLIYLFSRNRRNIFIWICENCWRNSFKIPLLIGHSPLCMKSHLKLAYSPFN